MAPLAPPIPMPMHAEEPAHNVIHTSESRHKVMCYVYSKLKRSCSTFAWEMGMEICHWLLVYSSLSYNSLFFRAVPISVKHSLRPVTAVQILISLIQVSDM